MSADLLRAATNLDLDADRAGVCTKISYRAVRNYGTIGGSVPLADPAADWPGCLMVLGAHVRISGLKGTRSNGWFVHPPPPCMHRMLHARSQDEWRSDGSAVEPRESLADFLRERAARSMR